ncbi:Ig-like domain-containing protein [Marinoscillum sp.]|uniref:Ig-like domain-containing protein n=1 Tax=Marinoscillum sp. TaxID=2024838 RepID=UPI003BAB4374
MKFLLLFSAALLLSLQPLSAQLADKWSVSYSNPNGPGSIEVADVLSDSNGDVYILATVFTGSDYDAHLLKYDSDGNKDWEKVYSTAHGSSEEHGVALTFDDSENIYALININPDDAVTTSQNGYAVRKYNSSGTLLGSTESVGMIGSVSSDITFLNYLNTSSNIYVSAHKQVSGEANNVRIVRYTTDVTFSDDVEYGGTSDEISGHIYVVGGGVYLSYYSGSTVGFVGYGYSFNSSSSTAGGDESFDAGSAVSEILNGGIIGSNYFIVAAMANGTTSLVYLSTSFAESSVIIPSTYTIHDVLIDDKIVLTGSKTVSGHEELVFLNYSGLTKSDEVLFDATHGSSSTVGYSIHENDAGGYDVGGIILADGSTYTGSVTFTGSDGTYSQGIASPYTSVSSTTPAFMMNGVNDDNIIVAETGTGIRLYAQCDAPTIDLGEDFTSTEGETETLGSDLPSGMTYSWSTGASSKTIDVTEDGTYSVTVTNSNGCSSSDEIIVDFLLPAPAKPTMLQPTIEQSGSPYADVGIHWSNDDPLATSHVVSQVYPDLGSEFTSEYSSTSNSQVIEISSGTFSRFSVASKNDDDVTGGSTPFFSLNGCTEYTMQQMETYLVNLSVAGSGSIEEGGTGTYSLTGFTPGEDELSSFFEWTFPEGWEITEYSQIMVKVAVAENASSGQVSVVIRNVCTGEATAAITKTVYAVKDQTITFDQPSDMQLGDEAISLGATASSGLEVSYSLNNDNAELSGSFLIAKHAGDVIVTACQAGNSEYNAAENVERTVTILKGDDEIFFESLDEVVWNADDLDLSDESSSRSDRDITWSGSDSEIASVSSSGIVNLHKPGTITITASLTANDDWNAPENVEQVLTVTKAGQTITFDPLPDKTEGDQNFNLSSYANASSGLALDYQSDNASVASISNGQLVIEGPGTATIRASQAGNDYYFAALDAEQMITVTEGTYIWEGGIWNLGESSSPSLIPDNTDNVEIRENYAFSIQGLFAAKNLTITTTGSVSVNNGSALEVKENLINNGSMTIHSGSSLLTYDGFSVSDNITFKRNTRYADGKYSFVGTPVEQDASITGTDLGAHVYQYDEAASSDPDALARWIDASSNELVPGQGYTQANQQLIEFTGRPNDGTISYTTSRVNDGYHLVSNPYPAAIHVDDFIDGNADITGTIYIWDDNGSDTGRGSNSDYIVVTKTAATDNNGPDNEARWNDHIGAMQGFFIQMDGAPGTVSFTESMRVSGSNADENFFRTSSTSLPVARINLTNEAGLFKQAVIGWNEEVSDTELTKGYDGKVFSTSGANMLYTMKGEHALAIQTITSQKELIPLTYQVEEAGIYTFSLDLDAAQGQTLYLIDKHTEETIDLSRESYSFNSAAGQFTDRFELVTNSRVLGLETNDIQVYAYEQTVYINLPEGTERTFELISLDGQRLLSRKLSRSAKIETNLPAGVYIVTDGEQSHKIILK